MSNDKDKGKATDIKGSARETWVKTTGDKETERSGKADQAEGKARSLGLTLIRDGCPSATCFWNG